MNEKTLYVWLLMWPKAIPASDFAKALALHATLDAATSPAPPVVISTKNEARNPRRVGKTAIADVARALRKLGPATVRDVMAEAGLHRSSVTAALRAVATTVGHLPKKVGEKGRRTKIYGLRQP